MTSASFLTSFLLRVSGPLRSRKTRVALVTILAAFAAEFGIDVSDELLLALVGVGASLILGIAHEDAGRKSAPLAPRPAPTRGDPDSRPAGPADR